jgi:hypothetical protein
MFFSASSVLSLNPPTFGFFFLLVVFLFRTYQGAWSGLPACLLAIPSLEYFY